MSRDESSKRVSMMYGGRMCLLPASGGNSVAGSMRLRKMESLRTNAPPWLTSATAVPSEKAFESGLWSACGGGGAGGHAGAVS